MKRIISFLTAILVISLVMVAFTACNDDPVDTNTDPDFTITVKGPDGNPFTGITVQPCHVETSGEVTTCYEIFKPVDANGVVTFRVSDPADKLPKDEKKLAIHLFGLPTHLTYEEGFVEKGKSIVVNVTYKSGDELDTPITGTGEASYLTGENEGMIDTKNDFSPYEVKYVNAGLAYSLKFNEAEQKIYFALTTQFAGNYRIYSVKGIDIKIVQLQGTVATALYDDGDASHSAQGVDCSYSFSSIKGGTVYFEISLQKAEDVNKEALLCIEEVK